MSYNETLKRLLGTATSMRATEGGFDPKRRGDSKTLFIIDERIKLAELVAHLEVDESCLDRRIHLMTTGTLQLNFLDGHSLITSVDYIFSDFLRWSEGGSDAQLINPLGLVRFLVDAGWDSSLAPIAIQLLSKRRPGLQESARRGGAS
jgi:hypothetical protein